LKSTEQQLDLALAKYRCLVTDPKTATELCQRAVDLMTTGNYQDSAAYFERSLVADPALAVTYFYQGVFFSTQERFAESLSAFERAQTLGLESADLRHNQGIALFNIQQPQAALACVESALEQATDLNLALILNTQGFILQSLGRVEAALASYKRALMHDPELDIAKLNHGIVSLMLGDLSPGWVGYESRWAGAHEVRLGAFKRPECQLPQWVGELVNGQDAVLVFSEQGLGDTIQFSRYLDLAAGVFGRVTFVCQPSLARLFAESFGDRIELLEVFPENQEFWQWQCPLLSLPLAFKTTLDTVPAKIPYLTPPADLLDKWRNRIAHLGGGISVGLVWAGANRLRLDAQRSIALEILLPLLKMDGVRFVSLQKGDAVNQIPADSALIDWSEELTDFAETAALVANLDLVISVDTAVAHLAGALGKPVWLLNRFASEWRWLHNREDSPWYPDMRIFNQDEAGDWEAVVSRIVPALSQKQAHFSGRPCVS
jgi:tetratricopeptide (TPR) repeat protein